MRARACLKCHEFVLVRPNDPKNQLLIKEFESHHMMHTLITLDYAEIKDTYKMYGAETQEEQTS